MLDQSPPLLTPPLRCDVGMREINSELGQQIINQEIIPDYFLRNTYTGIDDSGFVTEHEHK